MRDRCRVLWRAAAAQWSALRRAMTIIAVITSGGCATIADSPNGNPASRAPTVQSCAGWFRSLDHAIDASGVRDAGSYRIAGYPYLRVNRFLASFREGVQRDDEALSVWIRRLRELDAVARRFELSNLSQAQLRALGAANAAEALARTERCAVELQRVDLVGSGWRSALIDRAEVPDDYLQWQRVVGFYPVARIPFSQGVERWHEEALAMFRRNANSASGSTAPLHYVPPNAASRRGKQTAAAVLAASKKDRLGIPILGPAATEVLFAAFAPVFAVETTGEYDRPGAVVWRDGPEVDTVRPTVYRRLAYTRYGSETLVQLVYTLWFPERPYDGIFDLLAGKLDGIVLRVTLAPDGEPLVYDSIHPCGCYHMFFPTARVASNPAPNDYEEWAFIPTTVRPIGRDGRLVVRTATRTHYVVSVGWETTVPGEHVPYAFEEEDSLRSLATSDGRRSIYGPDGLVPGTARGERALFWPMGISSSGAMRQWGKHATAFIGRRHFDDADLIERRFTILPP